MKVWTIYSTLLEHRLNYSVCLIISIAMLIRKCINAIFTFTSIVYNIADLHIRRLVGGGFYNVFLGQVDDHYIAFLYLC